MGQQIGVPRPMPGGVPTPRAKSPQSKPLFKKFKKFLNKD
jgi:hypothetical protein